MTASAKNSSHNTDKRGKKDRRNHHRKKNHHHQPMASFAEAPAGDVAKGTRYTGFLLLIVYLHATRFTDVLSLSFFYFRTHRREDFQDEVRAVPRRRTGGRTQTGTRVCFRRHLFSERLWSV